MIKALCPVPAGLISTLEERLCELAPGDWFLQVNRLTGKGSLEGYFETEQEALEAWPGLADLFADPEPPLVFSEVRDRDWKEAYKDHFQPWNLGSLHWVPEWERDQYEVPAGHKALFLDPGMAFGTGLHETTRLCLGAMMEFADKHDVEDKCCIDAGCGSGILALSAKLLGFGKVQGFDVDPAAIRISIENAEANDLDGVTSFRVDDLDGGMQAESTDLLLANIQADVLCASALPLLCVLRPGGMLALSGILTREAMQTTEVFRQRARKADRQISLRRKDAGDWSLLTIERG